MGKFIAKITEKIEPKMSICNRWNIKAHCTAQWHTIGWYSFWKNIPIIIENI